MGRRQFSVLVAMCYWMIGFSIGVAAGNENQSQAASNQHTIPAQSWPLHPGPRTVPMEIFYPRGNRANVNAETGIILTLHNWGGAGAAGTADPRVLADRYNLIAVTVDYLQSGAAPKNSHEPYDFGYLQALDALRALHFVLDDLETAQISFDSQRIFAVGGSGGGNVALMCNKLAPRTFACIIDLSGMAKLSDDIAFGSPGGSTLNAGYSRDPHSPAYLSADAQQLRFIGDPGHLQTMRQLGNSCNVVVMHGVEDQSCPVEDARELVQNMQSAGINVDAHWIDPSKVDGKLFRNAGHSLGNRTEIVKRVADQYLSPNGTKSARRRGKSDFDLRDDLVRYRTSGGQFVISYQDDYPVGSFQATTD